MSQAVVAWLLVAACALHLGFQLTVTVLVYPALREVEPSRWRVAHDAHTRRITPVVVVVYGLMVLTCAASALAGPRTPWLWVTIALFVAVLLVTGAGAAPVHGALGQGHDPVLLARLTRVDLLRLALAACLFASAAGRALLRM